MRDIPFTKLLEDHNIFYVVDRGIYYVYYFEHLCFIADISYADNKLYFIYYDGIDTKNSKFYKSSFEQFIENTKTKREVVRKENLIKILKCI